uniref:Lipoprotein releasing system transmembrane protein lolC n=1 Tax=uncultured Thiotrichaceae bacterium TaxID=298394 RepID=A0A6S6U3S4_9GAMM|nr:MAG: Lipoprotein releasing system transmembrane protein lolC [uncultured Thiotrichaceae bacterium]
MTQHSQFPLGMLFMLAWRNLWRQRRRTLITLSSIAIGFGLAVMSIGLGDGSHNSMIRNAIKLGEGHLTIQPADYAAAPANHKYIADGLNISKQLDSLNINGSIEPRISLQILASTANNSVGAALEGIGSETDQRVLMLKPRLIEGEWIESNDQRGVLIGDGMAKKLKARIGSKVVLMAGSQGGDSQAQLGRVRGIFNSQVDELDDYLVLGNLQLARLFLEGEGADPTSQPVTRFAIFLDDQQQMANWKLAIQNTVTNPNISILSWQEVMPQLVQFIAIDDAGNYIFLLIILIMVVFGILNTVLMSVLERTREFGLLRALGMNRYHLLTLVFCETLLLSVLAVMVGWLAGGGLHWWLATNGLDFAAIMGGETAMMGTFIDPVVYSELSIGRVLQLTSLVFITTLATGIYPAIKAARVTPVEALRT